jgi:thiol-disulfide isomerase/thioredoxin
MSVTRRLFVRGVASVALLGSLVAVSPAVAPSVPLTDAASFKKQIAARKGKVVVVNFWATWCGPCVEEFPSLVKLQKTYKAKGLELLTLSCDNKRDAPKVAAFIGKSGQAGGAYQNASGVEIEGYLKYLEPKLDPEEAIGIPRTYIFDRSGKMVKMFASGQSYETFNKAVAPLIGKK